MVERPGVQGGGVRRVNGDHLSVGGRDAEIDRGPLPATVGPRFVRGVVFLVEELLLELRGEVRLLAAGHGDREPVLLRAIEADPTLEITIDVERRTVSAPKIGLETTFPIDDFTQYRLLNGLDDVGITLRNVDAIASFEATRPAWAATA